MIRRPIWSYFFFGTVIRYLQDAQPGYRIGDLEHAACVRSNLEQLFGYMTELNLRVTPRTSAASRLQALLNDLKIMKDNEVLTVEHARDLNSQVEELRETLEAELTSIFAYAISPKRLDPERLLDQPAALFAPGVFARLPDIARYDLAEAARCIAFEVPTAAAFHLMRATEAVLRGFYRSVASRARRARMWGEITADLRKRRSASRHAVLLNHLDNIRLSFRNPTQHPDARYNVDEVQDLWAVCVDVINRMAAVPR